MNVKYWYNFIVYTIYIMYISSYIMFSSVITYINWCLKIDTPS